VNLWAKLVACIAGRLGGPDHRGREMVIARTQTPRVEVVEAPWSIRRSGMRVGGANVVISRRYRQSWVAQRRAARSRRNRNLHR
jgi:hypothetical protein